MSVELLKYNELLAEKGRNLISAHVNGKGLIYADAVEAVRILQGTSLAILGGDVYKEERGRLRPTYLNWYCNRELDEVFETYVRRSHNVAMQFLIDNGRSLSDAEIIALVTLDPNVQPSSKG